jgi:hypothetical protein
VAVAPDHAHEVQALLAKHGMPDAPVGRMLRNDEAAGQDVVVSYSASRG